MDAKLVLVLIVMVACCVEAQPVSSDSSLATPQVRNPDLSEESSSEEFTESTVKRQAKESSESEEESRETSASGAPSKSSKLSQDPEGKKVKRQVPDDSSSLSSSSSESKERLPERQVPAVSDESSESEESEEAKPKRQILALQPQALGDSQEDANTTQSLYLIKTVTYQVGVVENVGSDDNSSIVVATPATRAEQEDVTIFYANPAAESAESTTMPLVTEEEASPAI